MEEHMRRKASYVIWAAVLAGTILLTGACSPPQSEPVNTVTLAGWGFGVEYNEIRGHFYMLIDQLEIDPSRLKAGGVCLTCKSPFAPKLQQELGPNYFKDPSVDVHAKIPAQFQRTGGMCIDCPANQTLDLKLS